MDIKSLLNNLDLKSIPCEYCDVRIEETFQSSIRFQNHELTTSLEKSSVGAFLRVRQHGQWYFSATTELTTLKEQLLTLATSPDIGGGTAWTKLPGNYGHFENVQSAKINPALIFLNEKVELIKKYDELSKNNPLVKSSRSVYGDIYKMKSYKNSVGTSFQYDFTQCGATFMFDLAEDGKMFSDRASIYGNSFAEIKNQEHEILGVLNNSHKFLHAPLVTPGKYNLVLNPEITGVFVHESFGHMSEADSMIGDPVAKETWKLGKKVAADFISIVDSGSHEGGSGYCPIDDEGHKATKTYLVKNGILSGRLHSFDTALALDEQPTGNGRAIGFEFDPIVRMTSTYIENGTTPIEDLFKMAGDGIYIENFDYGTGGDLFTVAPSRAYTIKDGKLSTPIRASVISGQLFETLHNIQAISNDFKLEHSALGGCGKGGQFPLPVSDGGPTILVKDMQVS
ncbi:TldD/PmbA family protein [Bdellovibrio sp. ZAP7]|uniref:TldD/PmbA family protein n=1 Tax=Bdellovibrio sp. ZAP7 TaxID=2231053 RepID=UPI00143DAF02|nr:TldD/PmbA family protein [Bdellovibrio sp. ZAP7]